MARLASADPLLAPPGSDSGLRSFLAFLPARQPMRDGAALVARSACLARSACFARSAADNSVNRAGSAFPLVILRSSRSNSSGSGMEGPLSLGMT